MVVDQLPRLGKRELVCLLLFTCNYVVFVWRGFLFLWVLGMGYIILLWHSLSLPYNYFVSSNLLNEKLFAHNFQLIRSYVMSFIIMFFNTVSDKIFVASHTNEYMFAFRSLSFLKSNW